MTTRLYPCVWMATLILIAACGDSGSDDPETNSVGDGMPDGGGIDIPTPECGDSIVQGEEACDDGNDDDGDGCTAECEVEAGWTCLAGGGGCVECGDGEIGASEQCDDGNQEDGDGCDASCSLEMGWECPLPGEPCEQCGNGVLEPNERCDEGDFADGLGCAEDCRSIDDNYTCPEPGVACVLCGDGAVEGDEVCDDGNNVSGDGCVANCMAVESGWVCATEGGGCSLCGDGVLDPMREECDDGNFQAGDGCSDACRLEEGSVCLQAGVQCSVCGNGFIEFVAIDDNGTPDDTSDDFYDVDDPAAREACDDGNLDGGDGCSAGCTLEDGGDLPWLCPLPGLGCGRCGDGMVQAIETCDDGVDGSSGQPVGSDGCSADCTAIEDNYLCPAAGGTCVLCGDGQLDAPLEACDDGNNLSGDGCNRKCELETDVPWVCSTPGQPCELCGNGVREPGEACDDGDREGGDGCAADCSMVEETYNCFFEGFACAQCGDGELQPGEQCDEGHVGSPDNLTDGCDNCQRVDPWACPAAGAPCELCGDGVIGSGDALVSFETCDDGNTLSSDGCSSTCQVEAGFVCNGDSCSAAACGDGFVAAGEECDDGNRTAGDGCSFLCRVEPGFDCSGAAGCRRSRCGDGIVEGDEVCDDAGATCASGGAQNGEPCVTQEDYELCLADDGTCAPTDMDGCDTSCQLEDGFTCPAAGAACVAAHCGDGVVEGLEQCDLGVAICDGPSSPINGEPCTELSHFELCLAANPPTSACMATEANGCNTDCTLKPGFVCEEGSVCSGADPLVDCCRPTVCGDGIVEGLEQCDDGMVCGGTGSDLDGTVCITQGEIDACEMAGGSCATASDDGCSDVCEIETFFRCSHEEGMPSECGPFVEYVSILRFDVANVNPVALHYDPDRRSFGGHKSQGAKASIELCLDGTIINQEDTRAGSNGTIIPPEGPLEALPVDCVDPGGDPCYSPPLRPDMVTDLQTMRGATYDPVTGHFLYTHSTNLGAALLVQLPRDLDITTTIDPAEYSVVLDFDAHGLTVGEDGDLYVADPSSELIRVLPRLRDAGLPAPPPDCSTTIPGDGNCTSFDPTPDDTRERVATVHAGSSLDGIFTFPGEELVGIFNRYTDAPSYTGYDELPEPPQEVSSANYFSIYDIFSTDPPERSALPGVLFSLGDVGRSYSNAAQAAETAADGAAFVICAETNSEDCQLFSRVCENDADCPSGATCNLDGMNTVGAAFCNAPGEARDDIFEVARDVYRVCTSGGDQNGLDCTASDTACLGQGGSCDQVGQADPQMLDVLANDTLSESACVDPRFTILAVCGDGVTQQYETDNPGSCVDEPVPQGTVTLEEGEIDYDAPDDGSCGFFDTFVYTVDLGGGVIDTAVVRVAVNCLCGDGIADGNEQCDDGEFNGDAGTCVDNCGAAPEEQVLARCSDQCLLNVLCGDGYIVPPEECDDRNTDNGDGCSAVCTRESECGNGEIELGEECDDGPDGSATCNPNCTMPFCGDGNLDLAVGEQCDDGNMRVGDGCNGTCQIEATCGNGTVEPGEDCDDGGTVPGDGCSATCQVENVCGNDDREGAEVCDGSDFGSCPVVNDVQIQCINSANGAPNICLCQNYCGDGKIGGDEECDEGADGSATCRGAAPSEGDACSEIRCGDGVVDAGETCDDGNTNPADSCTNDCQPPPSCGNGSIEAPEECDDGNNVSGDGCTATCQTEARNCGDGVVDSDEQCDDGNTDAGDGCDANCRIEGAVCGDGTRDPGEECDDGNTANGDGCSSSCRFELQ